MSKFNVGDKVVLLNQQQGYVYEVTYITRHGDYVIEHEAWGAIIHSGNHIELYKPPVFSYFHPVYGLHDWEVVDCTKYNDSVCIRSTSNENVWLYVPVALVEHYLEDKYVRR